MTYAFALIVAGGVALMSGIRNRPIFDILRGITDAVPGPGSGFLTGPPAGADVGRPPGLTGPVGSQEPGPPAWGGSAEVLDRMVVPSVGLAPGGRKEQRPSNPDSDHDPDNTLADAIDFPASEAAAIAAGRALAARLGFKGWRPNSYRSFTLKVGNARFRVQILAGGKIDHGDHLHVGVSRV